MNEVPTLFVCHGDDGGPRLLPVSTRAGSPPRQGDVEYEKVIAGHGHPIPFLRRGSRSNLRTVTSDTELPPSNSPTVRS